MAKIALYVKGTFFGAGGIVLLLLFFRKGLLTIESLMKRFHIPSFPNQTLEECAINMSGKIRMAFLVGLIKPKVLFPIANCASSLYYAALEGSLTGFSRYFPIKKVRETLSRCENLTLCLDNRNIHMKTRALYKRKEKLKGNFNAESRKCSQSYLLCTVQLKNKGLFRLCHSLIMAF